ncbi:interleukin-6 receptor subunit beta isoform X1 [Lepisosteus oculatus]|uniref:interleukin-6 receptor subunit beta isoform X1 n=1 Tax=Lepisosteus oculatus TaxID=7918 RepID=UPI003714BAA2
MEKLSKTKVSCSVRFICLLIVWIFQGGLSYTDKSSNLLQGQSTDVTISRENLKQCSNKCYCVQDLNHCPHDDSMKTESPDKVKILSCFYLLSPISVGCSLDRKGINPGNTSYSLIIKLNSRHCTYCTFNTFYNLEVSVIARNIISRSESTSNVYQLQSYAVKLHPPEITRVNGTKHSLHVMWNTESSEILGCRLRYKAHSADQWMQVSENVMMGRGSASSMYEIKDLQPFRNYSVSISCAASEHWSDWSAERLGQTLEDAPYKALNIWQTTQAPNSQKQRKVLLMWKPLDVSDANGIILGYRVYYMPTNKQALKKMINSTNLNETLFLSDEEYEVTVLAYNLVGNSPKSSLRIPAVGQEGMVVDLPAVRGVTITPEGNELCVEWETPKMPVTEYVIQWCLDTHPFQIHWQRINNTVLKISLKGELEPLKCYNISVYPIYEGVPGAPTSEQAYLKEGAPRIGPNVTLGGLTKNSAIVKWKEINKEERNGFIKNYLVILQSAEETQTQTVNSRELEYKFTNLTPNTKYTIWVVAFTNGGNSTSNKHTFKTPLFSTKDAVNTTVSVIILLFFMGIIFVFIKACFIKKTFFKIPNPSSSTLGKWLLNYTCEKQQNRDILKPDEDFLIGDLKVVNWSMPEEFKNPQISEHVENTVLILYAVDPPSINKLEGEDLCLKDVLSQTPLKSDYFHAAQIKAIFNNKECTNTENHECAYLESDVKHTEKQLSKRTASDTSIQPYITFNETRAT